MKFARHVVLVAWVALLSMLAVAGCSDAASGAEDDAGVVDSADASRAETASPNPDAGSGGDGGVEPDRDGELTIGGGTTPMTVQAQRVFTASRTVTWSVSAGGGGITERGVYTAPATPTVATITATTDAGKTAKVEIEVVAAPIATLSAPTVMTVSKSVSASVPVQEGATYAWTIIGGTITSDAKSDAITFSASETGTILLTCVVTNKAGSAISGSATIGVFATPVVSISAPSSTTAGVTGLVAKVPSETGATYAWTITGGTITAGQSAAAITFTAGVAGQLTLGCTVTAGGTPVSGSAEVTVHPALVPVVITAPGAVTASSTDLSASTAAQPGSTYAWTISGGAITGGQGTSAIAFSSNAAGTITLTCTVTNGAGAAASGEKTVVVVARPSAPIITVPSAVTGGSTGNRASVSLQTGFTFVCSVTGGKVTSSDANSITFDVDVAASSLVINCTVTNSIGTSAMGSVTVPVVNVPTAAITAPAKIGSGVFPASVTVQSGASYAWTIEGGTIAAGAKASAIEFSAGTTSTVTLHVTVTNAAGTSVSGVAVVLVERGTLAITFTDAPPNASATVTGPNGFVQAISMTTTTTLSNLEPGVYRVNVPETISNLLTWTPTLVPSSGEVAVTNGVTASFSATFTSHNQPPQITDPIFYDAAKPYRAVTTTVGTPVVFAANAVDPEGGQIDFRWSVPTNRPTSGLGLTLTAATSTGERLVTVTAGNAGVQEVTLTFCDPLKACVDQRFFLVALPSSGFSPIVTTTQDLATTVLGAAPSEVITFHPDLLGVPQDMGGLSLSKHQTIYGQAPDRTLLRVTAGSAFIVKNVNLTLIGVTIDGAGNTGGGSALTVAGGSALLVTVSDCVIKNNTSPSGSAIDFAPNPVGTLSVLTIERSSFSGNGVDVPVISVSPSSPTRLIMRDNLVMHDGGYGLLFQPTLADARLIQNTFITNRGTSVLRSGGTSASFYASHNTFAATGTPALAISSLASKMFVGGSLFDGFPQDSTLAGSVQTLGGNLLSSTDVGWPSTDLSGVSAGLGPLTGAGELRPWLSVRVPQASSAAISNSKSSSCTGGSGLLTIDQRGLPRTNPCDSGSVERQSTDP